MGNCLIRCFKTVDYDQQPLEYTCSDIEDLKKQFRVNNGTDQIIQSGRRDMYYEEYCKQLDHISDQCQCEQISLKCDKCPDEDHQGYQGYFCRCEDRNIRLAKQLRAEGKSWFQVEGQQGARL